MSPKFTLEKDKKKWKQRGERKKEKKKIMPALLVFMLSSLKTENCLMGEIYFGCKVTLWYKNLTRYIFFTHAADKKSDKKGYILNLIIK